MSAEDQEKFQLRNICWICNKLFDAGDMTFTINKNLFFIDSMQFMNTSLDALVRNLSENCFKYLFEESSGDLLKLVKQK